jgi:hypothetical protein
MFSAPSIETIWSRWSRYLLCRPNDDVVLVVVRAFSDNNLKCYINFYGPLYFLNSQFPSAIDGDLEVAKQRVDQLLIRVSKLTAFQ